MQSMEDMNFILELLANPVSRALAYSYNKGLGDKTLARVHGNCLQAREPSISMPQRTENVDFILEILQLIINIFY